MFPHGIIYDSRYKSLTGVVRVSASIGEKVLYTTLRGLGAGLIAFFILIFGFTIYPILKAEYNYDTGGRLISSTNVNQGDVTEKILEASGITATQKEAVEMGVDSNFSIVIPKIDARSKIIPNVDAANEKEYMEALKEGVAHAKGTYFPGQGKSIFLFAHSTDTPLNIARYNAVFYLLRKLEVGDEIIIFFADKKYTYHVTETTITAANDISWYSRDFGKESVVLQTCYPPGTSLKRLIVVAS